MKNMNINNEQEATWLSIRAFDAFGGDEIMWEIHGNPIVEWYCSNCKEAAILDEFGEDFLSPYCPFCGKKMKNPTK